MPYYEYLRARRSFVRFAAVVGAIAVLAVLSATLGSGHVVVGDGGGARTYALATLGAVPVPMPAIAEVAGFVTIGIATALATGFNLQTAHAHLAFVRPQSRTRMALAIIGVDVAAIVAAAGFTLAVTIAGIAIAIGPRARFVGAGDALAVGALGLGVSLMWYAILQAVTAWAPPRSASYAVGTGVALALAIPLAHATFLGPIASLFGLLLYVDPLAYLANVAPAGDGGGALAAGVFGGSPAVRAFATWALAAAFLALATFEWRRVEV